DRPPRTPPAPAAADSQRCRAPLRGAVVVGWVESSRPTESRGKPGGSRRLDPPYNADSQRCRAPLRGAVVVGWVESSRPTESRGKPGGSRRLDPPYNAPLIRQTQRSGHAFGRIAMLS